MTHFKDNCFSLAKNNTAFRKVLFTTDHSQLVLMSIAPKDEIPKEVHSVDQLFTFVEGHGEAILNGTVIPFKEEDTLIVPAGTTHTIKNTSTEPLKLYTIYTPPQHAADAYQETREKS